MRRGPNEAPALPKGARLPFAALFAVVILFAACEAVPSLTFDQQGNDAAPGGDAGCPGQPPQNATCCGSSHTVPCYGNYCGTACSAGCDKCSPPDICCAHNVNGSVVCDTSPSMCH